MTIASTVESAEEESWAPQHWSREEWFYMWTMGLDPQRIAKLCRVPYRKVYEHIHFKVSSQPERFGLRLMLHDHPKLPPGGLKKPKLKVPWAERAEELVEFRRLHGRFPRGYLEGEGKLYSFLQSQRERYRAGKLLRPRKQYLDEKLSGWLTPPKAERESVLWEQRLVEMQEFLRDSGRFPRYKTARSSAEKVLAVWITRQRDCHRRGKLEGRRREKLDTKLPGWKAERDAQSHEL